MAPGISRIFPETVPGATQKRKDPLKRHQEHPKDPHWTPECSKGAPRDPFKQLRDPPRDPMDPPMAPQGPPKAPQGTTKRSDNL